MLFVYTVSSWGGLARIAAELYQAARRPKGREIDLAIAACALSWNAVLWTLNPGDFEDLPGLQLR